MHLCPFVNQIDGASPPATRFLQASFRGLKRFPGVLTPSKLSPRWAVGHFTCTPGRASGCLTVQGTCPLPPPHAFSGPGLGPGCTDMGTQECGGGGGNSQPQLRPGVSGCLFSSGLSSASQDQGSGWRGVGRGRGECRNLRGKRPSQPMWFGPSPTRTPCTFSQHHLRTHSRYAEPFSAGLCALVRVYSACSSLQPPRFPVLVIPTP